MSEAIGVVRDQDHGGRLVLSAVGAAPAQLARRATGLGAEDVRGGVEHRPQLGVPVALALDCLGVEPERDVVDEHAAVDLGQVDAALPSGDEGVEGADDVVAVDPQIEREVVAGAGRDAGEGEVVLGCDRGDERLGAVTARGGETVGPGGHGVTDQLFQVVTGLQLDRLDPTRPSLVGQVVADGLAAAGPRVPDDDRALGRLGGREHHAHREDPPGHPRAGKQERHGGEADADPLAGENHDDRGDQEEHDARQENVPGVAAPLHCLPRCHRARNQQRHHHETTWEVADDLDDADDDTGQEQHQRHRRRHPPGDHSLTPSVGAGSCPGSTCYLTSFHAVAAPLSFTHAPGHEPDDGEAGRREDPE